MGLMFTIRDKTIPLFQYDCLLRREQKGIRPFVDISVYITNACNARCAFCCNGNRSDFRFDVSMFGDFFQEVSSRIEVNKLTFTGGEPTLKEAILHSCLDIVEGHCNLVTVNTNGTDMSVLYHKAIDRIALSRHHYNAEDNDRIFGTKIGNPLTNFKDKSKVIITCNLIRGEIDSTNKIYEMLEFASVNGIGEVCFIGLMPVNPFSVSSVISPNKIRFGKSVICTRSLCYKKGICGCKNYIYASNNGNLICFYTKHNRQPDYNKGSSITWEQNKIR